MKSYLAMLALAASLGSPQLAAQQWSWDPLKDVDNALPASAAITVSGTKFFKDGDLN